MSVILRDLDGMADFRKAEALQREVWGPGDIIDPGDLMMVIQHEGGLAAGAFDGETLLGYVFAFPTVTPGVQHSHRLAVVEAARGLGLGARLKWYQADWCLARGIRHVRWTYDPLRLANAALNINRLGATASTYHRDYYGEMGGINAGAPSDRLRADWFLDSPRVARCRAGGAALAAGAAATALRVPIPRDFGRMLAEDADAALAARLHGRAALESAFADGWTVAGVDPVTADYLLVREAADG